MEGYFPLKFEIHPSEDLCVQAPSLFMFSLVQVAVHLGIVLLGGKLLGYSRRDTLIASNANVGGKCFAVAVNQPSARILPHNEHPKG